jgi:two-component system, response regulator RegA
MKSVIVLIDDDRTFREVMARSLTRLNCTAFDFNHPQSALSKIELCDAPVVFLDLKLEDDSGLLWIGKIKQANQQAKFIVLTGYASISTAVEAIKLGADDYLAKPITAREILEHLRHNSAGKEVSVSAQPMSVERLEWEHIQKVLADNDGNVSATARALGMHRRTLQRKLAKRPVRR